MLVHKQNSTLKIQGWPLKTGQEKMFIPKNQGSESKVIVKNSFHYTTIYTRGRQPVGGRKAAQMWAHGWSLMGPGAVRKVQYSGSARHP